MIGKDEFGNLRLRERRKGGERLCICRYEVIISLWCEELVTDGFCFVKKVAKSSAVRVDEGGGGGGQRREENVLKSARESEQLLILLW